MKNYSTARRFLFFRSEKRLQHEKELASRLSDEKVIRQFRAFLVVRALDLIQNQQGRVRVSKKCRKASEAWLKWCVLKTCLERRRKPSFLWPWTGFQEWLAIQLASICHYIKGWVRVLSWRPTFQLTEEGMLAWLKGASREDFRMSHARFNETTVKQISSKLSIDSNNMPTFRPLQWRMKLRKNRRIDRRLKSDNR